MDKLKFRQSRESRLIAGVVVLIFGAGLMFFTVLVALESFAENPAGISLFLLLGVAMLAAGFYFSACIPVIELDANTRSIVIMTSCIIFQTKKIKSFDEVREVGIKESYMAGNYGDETGTSYFVEIRCKGILEVPGTKNGNLYRAAHTAKEISDYIGVRFNPENRKVFTGSFKAG